MLAARVALAITLALRPETPVTWPEKSPYIAVLLSKARNARLQVDGFPATSAIAPVRPRPNGKLASNHRLRIESPCPGTAVHWAEPAADVNLRKNLVEDTDDWVGHCVCCKRPLTITLEPEPPAKKRAHSKKRNAYVCALWGTDPQFVLGAMVLGWSLRRAGTKHELVAIHTEDVAPAAVALLRKAGWQVRQIPYMKACNAFFWPGTRFRDVFTKLHAFGLIEYDKILLLDSDLLVRDNLDELFELPAPAAMARGPCNGYSHGQRIDGRRFFGGYQGLGEEAEYSWGQCTGINAGVMLLEPSLETLDLCMQEVADPLHPEHIRGSGPEQDYLSRFFASNWTHIGVAYNYQLHQMYFTVNPFVCENGDRTLFLRNPKSIKVFHYSSDPKPWLRHLDPKYAVLSNQEWLREVQNTFRGFRSWVLKDPEYLALERECDTVAIGEDGELHHVSYTTGKDGEQTKVLGEPLVVPAWAIDAAEAITKMSLDLWDQAYRELAADIEVPDLAAEVVAAATSDPTLGWGSADAPNANSVTVKESPVDSDLSCWRYTDAWSADRDSAEGRRATLLASMLPEACASISVDGNQLISAKGRGVHIALLEVIDDADATQTQQIIRSFSGTESVEVISHWAESVPKGVLVLMAVVDPGDAGLTAVYKALTHCLGPSNLSPLPKGCMVAVAVGKKGETPWADTCASAEVASLVLCVP